MSIPADTTKIYRFHENCGRNGSLNGLFTATDELIEWAMGKTVMFDEALGKHTEIEVTLSEENLSIIEATPEQLEWFIKNISTFGHNPMELLEEQEEYHDENCECEDCMKQAHRDYLEEKETYERADMARSYLNMEDSE